MKKIGLLTGSFDPITKGHVDIIERASQLFDLFYVGIFFNSSKTGLFPIETRERLVKESLAHLPHIEVLTSSDELAVEVAKRHHVTHFVRGLRNNMDLTYEMNMEFYNQALDNTIETVYLSSKGDYQFLSSSRVRELIHFKAPIGAYVPEAVIREVGVYEEK